VAQHKPVPDDAKDRAAIERTLKNFLDAWNTHDAHTFSLAFTPDADFTSVIGMHAHDRANVETFHARIFATVFKHSHQTGQIRSIRFLTTRLAAVDVDWQMTGATGRDGRPRPERKGLLDWIMAKQPDGSWLIEVMHNTELTNAPGATK
jgi:uncharacterized protein (TIGR02246 family)